jgi:hypothetical protein
MSVIVRVAVGFGRNHNAVLYYNIKDVHKPMAADGLERTAGGMTNTVNDDAGRIRSVEDHRGYGLATARRRSPLFVARPLLGWSAACSSNRVMFET